MSSQIKVYSGDLKALGSTSKAFNVKKNEELMREYTLDFSVANSDSIFQYLTEDTVFEYGGQKFDISGIDGNSGSTNITQITAEHISYRLADYTLPNGYSFVGTVKEIAEDILNEAKTVDEIPASTVFSVGSTADLGTLNFSMSGATNVTAREALIAMSDLGVEAEFDNFKVNLPQSRGTDKGVVFKYSQNLTGVHRTWQRGNGWSYDINIVDLQKTPDYKGETYGIGDYITVEDKLMNLTLKKRIISYTECDDPTQNRVTVGVFVRDNASLSIETDRIANTANTTAQNSVQQGERYSNVSITHTDGFKAVSKDGVLRTVMNGDDCFAVQTKQNDGTWKTVTAAELWGMLTTRLTTPEAKERFYATIGKISSNMYGLRLISKRDGKESAVIEIGEMENELGPTIKSNYPIVFQIPSGYGIFTEDTNGNICQKLSTQGASGNIYTGNIRIKVEYGIITGWEGV